MADRPVALHFLPDLPDRILVREGTRFSDLVYSQLRMHCDKGV